MSTAPSSSHDVVPDELRSTWPQRAWTLAGSAAILATLVTSARLVAASGSASTDMLAAAVAAFAGYSLADLTTGVYHWSIDNYGDAETPVFGAQIVAFLDHHVHPSVITRLEPCNNLHVVAGAVAVALPAAGAALSVRGSPAAAHAFACAFAACIMLSVQFHAWAHERRSRLPLGVAALQDAGVLVSRSQHAVHHRPPYNSNYCTVSGMWNPVLDGCKVFEAAEKVIYLATGVQPRSWGMKT
ncbi:Fatty acid desaturase 4, chloroplastic [Dichanthelium oligosanthes]|uniref:Fatty acid desaturase 4, chloroplastic n=1 Tax=Dichanthelium oligosanthes TaxID=888268 RepID=A0A1E5V0A7_9POAL|nr:Fatty acid desaturase 4, chloroplastic [Dichanthelium oligosanthes]